MTREPGAADLRLDPRYVRRTLKEAGLHARHSMGQNFLSDVDVLEGILREAAPGPGRGVLEIGPGLGFLTGGLIAAGATVTADAVTDVTVPMSMAFWCSRSASRTVARAALGSPWRTIWRKCSSSGAFGTAVVR